MFGLGNFIIDAPFGQNGFCIPHCLIRCTLFGKMFGHRAMNGNNAVALQGRMKGSDIAIPHYPFGVLDHSLKIQSVKQMNHTVAAT